MSAAEDLILTITAGGLGQAVLQPRLSGARAAAAGRQGDVDRAMRGGPLVASFPVELTDQIMLATSTGQSIRVPVDQISLPLALGGRREGVQHRRDEEVVSVARIADQGDDEA